MNRRTLESTWGTHRAGPSAAQHPAAQSQLISAIYDTVLDPGLWPGVLEQIRAALNGSVVGIVHMDRVNASANLLHHTADLRDAQQDYLNHWGRLDPCLALVAQRPVGNAVAASQGYARRAWEATDFHRHYAGPRRLSDELEVRLFADAQRATFIGCARVLEAGAFHTLDVTYVQGPVPHLQRALQISRYCTGLQDRSDSAFAVLERLAQGVLLLDGEGRAVFVNTCAEALLSGPAGGLRVTGGRLTAADPAESGRLQGAIAEAIATAQGTGTGAGGMCVLTRRDGSKVLALVAPLSTRCHPMGLGEGRVHAIVLLHEPGSAALLSAEALWLLFGLTGAEARLALALTEGHTPAEAALRLGLRLPTVRTQLRAVFAKTGVRRQAELMRLLTGYAQTART